MKINHHIGLKDVQAAYSGPERDLWELVMGEQIHVGGLSSSMDLADKAGIRVGMCGVDLCSCTGAGMRFLVRFRQVARMVGVDATSRMVALGTERCRKEGLDDRIQFVLADVCDSGLPGESTGFVWGEDAWCYVVDKTKLIAEAARLIQRGGVIAFTDWIEGPAGLTGDEAARLLTFMKFPSLQDLSGYRESLAGNGLTILHAEYTNRFAPHVDLYLDMLNKQLTYDALKIIGFDMALMNYMAGEMVFMQKLAHAGKLEQGLFVARKE